MKKYILIIIFVLYYLFIPFVFTQCGGEDPDFNRLAEGTGEGQGQEETPALSECEQAQFLTADCVEEIKEKEKKTTEALVGLMKLLQPRRE